METTILVISIIQCFALAFYIFYKSYLKKKGDNKATIEDIGVITQISESVKNVFTTETEKLKKELDLIFNVKLHLANEERNAIIEFHKLHTDWIDGCINSIYAHRYNSENFNELRHEIERISKLKSDCSAKRSYIHLYSNDETLIDLSADLVMKSMELSDWLTINLTALHSELAYEKSCNIQFLELLNNKMLNERAKQLDKFANDSKLKSASIKKEVNEQIFQMNKPTITAKVKFTNYAREYIRHKF